MRGAEAAWVAEAIQAGERDLQMLLNKSQVYDPDPADKSDALTDVVVSQLASLSPIDYDRVREAEAKELGVRVSVLDAEVKKARKSATDEDEMFAELEPWPELVDGKALLQDIANTFRRYVILPEHADTVAALWVLNTYVHDASYHSPMIVLTSPEKRCGKTTALSVFTALCNRALAASNVSGAVVFRAIEKWKPTLLIDEADTFIRDNDDLRGVINSGHSKAGAFVLRCDGDANEPRRFSTWCPKVLSGIGKLRDTLEDRSIIFPLRRKLPDEKVSRLRLDRGGFDEIKQKCVRWAEDNFHKVAASDPEIPKGLNDRAADNWAPLLAIADLSGYGEQLRAAALALSGSSEDESVRAMLLADIRVIFTRRGVDRIASATLCDDLAEMDERPWPEWGKGKPITPRQLARLLQPFGIHSKTIRFPDDRVKGYEESSFKDAFARYLIFIRDTVTSQQRQHKTDISKRDKMESVSDEKQPEMLGNKECHGVTDEIPPTSSYDPLNDRVSLSI